MFSQESTLKKTLKTKKKKTVKVKKGEKDQEEVNEAEEEEEEEEGAEVNEGEQDNSSHREKASSALIPPPKDKKIKRKAKVKEEPLDLQESLDNEEKPLKGKNRLLMAYVYFITSCLRIEI